MHTPSEIERPSYELRVTGLGVTCKHFAESLFFHAEKEMQQKDMIFVVTWFLYCARFLASDPDPQTFLFIDKVVAKA